MGSSDKRTKKEIELAELRKVKQQVYDRATDFSDRGRANALREIVGGTLRFVPEKRQWLIWLDGRWLVDEHETFVRNRALQVAYQYQEMAAVERKKGNSDAAKDFEKEAVRCRNRQTLDNMIHELTRTIGVPLSLSELDQKPWLLGVQNGVVDLRTGRLQTDEAAADYVTQRCAVPYVPDAKAPRWEQFIAEITGLPIENARDVNDFMPRPKLARYLQKLLGYSLSASTREEKFIVAIGAGSNGKSKLFETVEHLLGDYATPVPASALMATAHAADSERATPVAASMAGKRLVIASESKDTAKLDVSLIKNHTGDAKMIARFMRKDTFEFTITHKLILLTNHRPALDHIDDAIRGRLHLIPFDRKWNRPGDIERDPTLPDGDKTLAEALRNESQGILAWLVRGFLMYQQEGLTPPAEVLAMTRDYVMSQDHLGRWLEASCERCGSGEGDMAVDLFGYFNRWCRDEAVNSPFMNPAAFGIALSRKGVAVSRTKTGARRGLRCIVKPAGEFSADDLESLPGDDLL